jgi:hypothetical protein
MRALQIPRRTARMTALEPIRVKLHWIPVVALIASDAPAQTLPIVPLDVKPGLWAISRTAESLPIGLRGMAPEVRQKLMDEVRKQESPRVIRQEWQRCLTAEEVRDAFKPAEEPQCRFNVLKSDATMLSVDLQCEADEKRPRRDGSFQVKAESPERLQAEIDLNLGEAGNASTLITRLTAKWIGADCSAAAPAVTPPTK